MANPNGYTDEELALLTDEEREGLLEDEEQEEDNDTPPGDDTKPGDDDTPPGDDDTPPGDDTPKGDDAPPADDKAATAEQQAPAQRQPRPLISAEAPSDLQTKLSDIATRKSALREKFNDGDITTDEYETQLDALNDERDDLKWAQRKAELSTETTSNQQMATWETTIGSFLDAHPEITQNQTRIAGFDAVLRQVTAPVMQAGGFPGQAEIDQAFKVWAEDLGITPPTTEQQQQKQETQQQAKPPKQKVPPTLGGLPAAAATDTDDGKFATLDRLYSTDPLAYEAAVARMSDAEFNEWANSNS